MVAKHPIVHRTAFPVTKNYPAPHVSGDEVEKQRFETGS